MQVSSSSSQPSPIANLFYKPKNIENVPMSYFASFFYSEPKLLAKDILNAVKAGTLEVLLKQNVDINSTDNFGATALHLAVESGDEKSVTYLLNRTKINVNLKKNDGFTALHLAAFHGHAKIASLLLFSGADVDSKQNLTLWTPLHYACCYGHADVVQQLIRNHADKNLKAIINSNDKRAWSPLQLAAIQGHSEIILILENRADKTELSNLNKSIALCLAAHEGHFNSVRVLIDTGSPVFTPGNDAILLAAKNQHIEILVYLVIAAEENIDFNEEYKQKISLLLRNDEHKNKFNELVTKLYETKETTPFHLAAFYNYPELVRISLQKNPNVIYQINQDHQTALHLVCSQDHIARKIDHAEVMELLIFNSKVNKVEFKKSFINAIDNNKFTALHLLLKSNFSSFEVNLFAPFFLEKGADVNLADINNWTPLHYASKKGDKKIASVLLKYGARFNAITNSGQTSLHIATSHGYSNIVELLVDAGAQLDIKNNDKNSPLHTACQNNDIESVKILLNAGAEVNSKNILGHAPLHIALNGRNLELIKLLVKSGAHPNIEDKNKKTPLQFGSERGCIELVEELILAKADLDFQDNSFSTALHKACENGHLEIVKLLVAAGADIYLFNRFSHTPAFVAQQKGFKEIVYFLTEAKSQKKLGWSPLHFASRDNLFNIAYHLISLPKKEDEDRVNIQNSLNESPLFFAVQNGQLEICAALLTAGANCDFQNKMGETVLSIAASKGHTPIVVALIKVGANLNLQTLAGDTPLISAFKNKNFDIVTLLIEAGANLNIGDKNGRTLLHMASQHGNEKIVKLLFAAGAEHDLKTSKEDGELTPYQLAVENNHLKVAKCIEGILLKQKHCQWTPIHLAARKGYLEITKLLIAGGIDINTKTTENSTPLQLAYSKKRNEISKLLEDAELKIIRDGFSPFLLAVYFGHIEMVKTHLNLNKEDINSINKYGFTALHIACKFGHTEIVKYLLSCGADVDIKNNEGQTALQITQLKGDKEISYLLDYTLAYIDADREEAEEEEKRNAVVFKPKENIILEKPAPLDENLLHIFTKAGLIKQKNGVKSKNYNWCANPKTSKEEANLPEDSEEVLLKEGEFVPKNLEKMRAYKITNKNPKEVGNVFEIIKKIKDKHTKMDTKFAFHFPNKVNQDEENFSLEYLKSNYIIKVKMNGITHYSFAQNEPVVYNKLYSKFLFPITGQFYHTATCCPDGHLSELSVLENNFKYNTPGKCYVGQHDLPLNHNSNNFKQFYEAEEEYSLAYYPNYIEKEIGKKHSGLAQYLEDFANYGEYWAVKSFPALKDAIHIVGKPIAEEYIEMSEFAIDMGLDFTDSAACFIEATHEVSNGNYTHAVHESLKGVASLARPIGVGINCLVDKSVGIVTKPITNVTGKIIKNVICDQAKKSKEKKNIPVGQLKLKIACYILRLNKTSRRSQKAVETAYRQAFKLYNHKQVQEKFNINPKSISKALYYARECVYQYNNWPLIENNVVAENIS